MNSIKKIIFKGGLLLTLFSFKGVNAQYLQNPSFDSDTSDIRYTFNPPGINFIPTLWDSCKGTPDNPKNVNGFSPGSGSAFIRLVDNGNTDIFDERLSNALLKPLIKGKPYAFSFYVLDNRFASTINLKIGVEISGGIAACQYGKIQYKLDSVPQVWTKICDFIIPDSNYTYIGLSTVTSFPSSQIKGVYLDDMKLYDYPALNITGKNLVCLGETDTLKIPNVCGMNYLLESSSRLQPFKINDSTYVVNYDTLGFYTFKIKATHVKLQDSASISVLVQDCTLPPLSKDIVIPNLITDNNDGRNDFFRILNLPPKTKLEIFNRWGDRVFESADYTNDWRGEEGVYYYLLKTGDRSYKGWIQVVK